MLYKSTYKPVLYNLEKDENTNLDNTAECMRIGSKRKKSQQKMPKKDVQNEPDKGLETNRYMLRNNVYFIYLNMKVLLTLLQL